MVKVTRVSGRGTKRRSEDLKPANWSGKKFKEYQSERMRKAGGSARLTSGRGTRIVRASDIKDTKTPDTSGYYISTGRGTGRRKLK